MKLSKLIVKKLNGTVSEEEKEFLNNWIQKSSENKELFSKLKDLRRRGVDISELSNLDSISAWEIVLQKYKSKTVYSPNKFISQAVLKYAAIFIGILILSYGYYEYTSLKESVSLNSNAITLELDNGAIRVLKFNDSELVTNGEGSILGKKVGNKLIYMYENEGSELVFNTLNIPHGKRFQIELSDGTTVHLNAGSSLRYPIKFLKNQERRVFLNGEGFFDVTEDKDRSFIVSASDIDVTVLGTEFNVTTYPEEKYIQTVLVEGSVSLSNSEKGKDLKKEVYRLEPGYKADWNVGKAEIMIEPVDTSIYTDWMEGKLVLKNLSFKNIVKRLERHYDIKIENNYEILNDQIFTASFDLETIEDVLDSFNDAIKFNYVIDNKTIIINQPKK